MNHAAQPRTTLTMTARTATFLAIAGAIASTCTIASAQAPARNRDLPPPSPEQIAQVDEAVPQTARVRGDAPRLILVTARTEGFYHASIPIGLHAIKQLGQRTGAYDVEIDHEMSAFTAENLKRFDAILFLSTTKLAFADPAARKALLDFVNNGKGIVGIHAASDNFDTWPEGQALIGGVFHNHPWLSKDTVAVKLDEPQHPLNAAFGGRGFWIRDEIYQIVGPYGRDRQRVLMSLDMSRPENERPAKAIVRTDGDFPIGWLKNQGRGRVFYSSLGHNHDVFWTTQVLQHWLDGIQFAIGDLEAPAAPSSTLTPAPVPALAPALSQTLLETGAARSDTASAFTAANLDAVARHKDAQDPIALHRISAALRDPTPAARESAQSALLKLAARKDLTPDATRAVIDWLGDVGDDRAVPVLTSWGRKAVTADRAIRALDRIPGAAADAALITLIKAAPAAHRASVVDSLGQRRAPGSVPAISGLLKSRDAGLASAAINALSRIASADALVSLTSFKAGPKHTLDLDWALINAALVLERDGDAAGALQLIRTANTRASLTPAQRVATHVAWLRLDPAAALPAVQSLLGDPYLGMRLAGPWLTATLASPNSEATITALTADFEKLPEPVQLAFLAQVGDFDRADLAPLARRAANSASPEVRHAAFAALATCGDLNDSAMLIAALARADDRAAAAEALERQPSAGLEPRLRAAIEGAAPEVHESLLLILGNRLDRDAMPLMLAAASGTARAPRAAGYRGLAALARGEDLPLILSLREQLQPADRRHWQEALRAAVRGRNDVPETVAMLRAEIDAATPAERPAFLNAIIGFETPESLEAVRELLASDDVERRKEMVRSLAAARSQASFDLLIDVAEKDADTNTRTLALRGFLDTLALRKERWSETIKAYGRAGRAALRQEEREAVISALSTSFQGSESEKIIAEIKALPALAES